MQPNSGSSSGSLQTCICGFVARIFTSKTERNLGRRFFGCPLYKEGGTEHCKFFRWLDEKVELDKVIADNVEKDIVIRQLRMTIMELQYDMTKEAEDVAKVIKRQRILLAGLSAFIVLAFLLIVFG
ncbi:uncharacterized protein LOC111832363 [Capsella rubella]|uniref:uncharacterized protein LOC111832363 n=1 Tax=Capsella rubella TaxID=81985 RepID=UPI000CD5AEAB|nr:uncharacterized protein LOC111832363 [Capsella rubella]